MLLSVEIPNFPKTFLTMMTQDRAALGITAPTSPRNLNPTAPAFHQNQAAPFSPQNLNPSAPVFHHSPTGERSHLEDIYSRAEAGHQVLLTNGDISANSTNYLMSIGGPMLREASPQSQLAHQIQSSMQNSMSMGHALAPHPMGAGPSSNHQPGLSAVTSQQQAAYVMAIQDAANSQRVQKPARSSNPSSPYIGNGEAYENPPTVALGGDEEASKDAGRSVELDGAGGGQEYPEEVLAPIIKQMQFYFSNENLPNDKFLNQHMDMDKYIPLELFLDFGRIKPICNSVDQLTKAVESSSILELSEDRKRVRVSQCRKTLTLRGFPQSATEEDVRQFIVEMGANVPTHIEFVMFKEKYSVWYVSFKDETAALNSFFQFHNKRAVYKDHTIGCCIKSSGTLAAAGYFPSAEESNQRRMAYQSQVAATVPAPVHAVQNPIPQPQPQQPPALMQPFSAMLHSYLPAGSAANIYYQQAPQGSYMPYMAGMIHSWPTPSSPLEPGLIMQSGGLQPQHIRASMPRAHMIPPGNAAQHRFNRPQRTRQNNVESSNLERPGDRSSIASVSGPTRSSPLISDNNSAVTVISQGPYVPRRPTVQEEIPPPGIPQQQVVAHQFVTPLVQQQQQQHVTTAAPVPTAVVNPSVLESVAVPHYQTLPHHHHHHHHLPQHHHNSIMVQTDTATAPPPPTPQITSNPPPSSQQMHHNHNQPPPLVPHHHHHHHQQQPQPSHHQQQHQSVQHSNQNHHHFSQSMPPLLQPHHQQQAPTNHTQHHHSQQQHNMVSPYHQHHSQQHHHQYLPPKVHHQQFPPGNRNDKRSRRKKEDNVKNHRGERGQSNRANFSAQAMAAADNFTMEANSFPPLPGALNSISNSEVSHADRMSDIVRGISRNPGLGNSSISTAPSSTPSPVQTPTPGSVASTTGQHLALSASGLGDDSILDNGDLALDDDVTSSSQEEVETDITIFESRSVRAEHQSLSSAAEAAVFSSQMGVRVQKMNLPSVPPPAAVLTQRQSDNRHGSAVVLAEGKGQQPPAHVHHQLQHRQSSPSAVSAAILTSEAPKLSYAQILALKNREASNNACSGDNSSSGGLAVNPSSATPNEPILAHEGNNTTTTGGNRTSAQSTNAFREHGNYQGGQQHGPRSSQRGSSKDSMPRSEGPPSSSRQPSGSRRNSKENRTWNKYDRRKPDTRPN